MKSKYIIAVSGGVDSVVLLHKLVSVAPEGVMYIVAHFDHGIRSDSADDAEFVRELAKKYDVGFVTERAELGPDASEELARNKRYEFLRSVMHKFKAEGIIVAHHQDDVVETMIVNMLRGTGARGLVGFSQHGIVRPFIRKTKQDLLDYAKEHDLKWHEDSTNSDDKYMRNYVRQNLIPRLGKSDVDELLSIRSGLSELTLEINSLSKKMLVGLCRLTRAYGMDGIDNEGNKVYELYRPKFVALSYVVRRELIATLLRLEGVEISMDMVERAVNAVATLGVKKHIVLKKGAELHSAKDLVLFKITPQSV